MSTPNRPSDMWLERETVVLEGAEVSIGLVTVSGIKAGTTAIGFVTAYPGALFPTTTSGITVYHGDTTGIKAGVAGIGFATVSVGAGASWVGLATVNIGQAERYSFKYFANANTSLATTFAVKGSAGFIHTISVGSASNPTIGLFDHATTATNPVFVVNPGTPVRNYILDESLANGLVAEVSEGENTALNISYK